MEITIYELITLIKNKKAPKKIKINEDILNLEIGKETLYRFEKGCGSLSFDYYIDNNKLDNKIEILDKDFKLETTPTISKLYINNELQYDLKEEKKIPEKLIIGVTEYDEIHINNEISTERQVREVADKLNEVLDYLQSKGE